MEAVVKHCMGPAGLCHIIKGKSYESSGQTLGPVGLCHIIQDKYV